MNKGYLYLTIAVISGCIGNIMAKQSNGFTKILPSVIASITLLIYIYCFAIALKTIPLGLTYITYSTILVLFTTLFGICFYNEHFNKYTILGTILILSGITIIYLKKN
jgi:small multidrug resistance pump|uniref:EamA domain-containing protein n=1 Tax=viral metagenome TaxID=1070528 RepID=A0A6C0AMD7_9ZZZZ